MKPVTDEFKTVLGQTLDAKQTDKKLAIFDGMMDKLLDLLMGLFDQCMGQLSPSQVAERVSNPSTFDKIRFRSRVRKHVYASSDDYKHNGGQHVADSVLETTQSLGKEKCHILIEELTTGDNFWPNDDLMMG